ncbi:MAG: hypothetical protein CMK09_04680 [Ponticaulis sp.]|nr:hypothetical protein [Ponticaulis sp.]|tara:strand:- start:25867 stop:27609 length:1743 start_codon:yes stop_codon:yes gene_type:complete
MFERSNGIIRRTLKTAGLMTTIGLLSFSQAAYADETTEIILVVDSSNSMWGQIDGISKMEIAKQTIDKFLPQIDAGTHVGAIAYGHRRKGDCSDIEVISTPVSGQTSDIATRINSLVPRGKTPITEALSEAVSIADAGKSTSVILVSDGVETCGGDPCAFAREMAAKQIDLKAHVIGFDIRAEQEKAQLACIASATGGLYLDAENASGLSEALETSIQASAQSEEPALQTVSLRAIRGADGPQIDPASFQVFDASSETLVAETQSGNVNLTAGSYRIIAETDEGTGSVQTVVTSGQEDASITVIIEAVAPDAKLDFDPQQPANSLFLVEWSGPADPDDYLDIIHADGRPLDEPRYQYISDEGQIEMRAPREPGQYQVRYMNAPRSAVLVSEALTVGAPLASLEAPDQVELSGQFNIVWQGPAGEGDYVGIFETGAAPTEYVGELWNTVAEGWNELSFTAPAELGVYELRYIKANDDSVLATTTFEVISPPGQLEAPSSAAARGSVEVYWTGEHFKGPDVITILPADAPDTLEGPEANSILFLGTPVTLPMPETRGAYEVRYLRINNGEVTLISRSPLSVN